MIYKIKNQSNNEFINIYKKNDKTYKAALCGLYYSYFEPQKYYPKVIFSEDFNNECEALESVIKAGYKLERN